MHIGRHLCFGDYSSNFDEGGCDDMIITIGGWRREEENRAKNAERAAGLQCSGAEEKAERSKKWHRPGAEDGVTRLSVCWIEVRGTDTEGED